MSNTKWKRALAALALSELQIKQVIWKFVGEDAEVRGALPPENALLYDRVACSVSPSPFFYRQIEWIEIPRKGFHPPYEKIPAGHWGARRRSGPSRS
jgi:hypothetical protein